MFETSVFHCSIYKSLVCQCPCLWYTCFVHAYLSYLFINYCQACFFRLFTILNYSCLTVFECSSVPFRFIIIPEIGVPICYLYRLNFVTVSGSSVRWAQYQYYYLNIKMQVVKLYFFVFLQYFCLLQPFYWVSAVYKTLQMLDNSENSHK